MAHFGAVSSLCGSRLSRVVSKGAMECTLLQESLILAHFAAFCCTSGALLLQFQTVSDSLEQFRRRQSLAEWARDSLRRPFGASPFGPFVCTRLPLAVSDGGAFGHSAVKGSRNLYQFPLLAHSAGQVAFSAARLSEVVLGRKFNKKSGR